MAKYARSALAHWIKQVYEWQPTQSSRESLPRQTLPGSDGTPLNGSFDVFQLGHSTP